MMGQVTQNVISTFLTGVTFQIHHPCRDRRLGRGLRLYRSGQSEGVEICTDFL